MPGEKLYIVQTGNSAIELLLNLNVMFEVSRTEVLTLNLSTSDVDKLG